MQEFQQRVNSQVVDNSIVTSYGKRQTYRVALIDFDNGPCSTYFELRDGSKISVAKYFFQEYGLKIKDKKQPMVFVKKGKDQYLKIPSEYCMVDGVPDTIKGNPMSMRKLLGTTRTNPEKKM
jgi:hypothetical protein